MTKGLEWSTKKGPCGCFCSVDFVGERKANWRKVQMHIEQENRMTTQRQPFSIACLLMLAGCLAWPTPPARAAEEFDAAIVARGEALFQKQCAICHGETGDGQGKFAYLMNPRPRNFLQGKF